MLAVQLMNSGRLYAWYLGFAAGALNAIGIFVLHALVDREVSADGLMWWASWFSVTLLPLMAAVAHLEFALLTQRLRGVASAAYFYYEFVLVSNPFSESAWEGRLVGAIVALALFTAARFTSDGGTGAHPSRVRTSVWMLLGSIHLGLAAGWLVVFPNIPTLFFRFVPFGVAVEALLVLRIAETLVGRRNVPYPERE